MDDKRIFANLGKNLTPYMGVDACSRAIGISTFFLRKGIREGTVPYIQSGRKLLIDVEALLAQLHESARNHN
jgi:hypothetical protein